MTDIPTTMDELVRDSRARIARMRRQLGNPADFDKYVRRVIEESLENYPPKARAFTLEAMFGKDYSNGS